MTQGDWIDILSWMPEAAKRNHMAVGQPAEISPGSVRAQMEKILNCEGFVRSERLSRFLRFTVDRALDGKAAELKESILAVEVFDRKADFDTRLNTVVRVEARRLRSSLLAYYATTGQDDPILIEYPKGGY